MADENRTTMEKTKLEEVREIMADLREKKAKAFSQIKELHETETGKLEAAKTAMNAATNALDIDAYQKAAEEAKRAESMIAMLNNRSTMLHQNAANAIIPEEQSDAVIEELLQYKVEIAAAFRRDIAEHVIALNDLYTRYTEELAGTENAIREWNAEIRSKYREYIFNAASSGSAESTATGKYLRSIPIGSIIKEGSE